MADVQKNGQFIEVNSDKIDFVELQPRSEDEYDASNPAMKSLIKSIKQDGLLFPPLAIPSPKAEGRYIVIAGRRRATAVIEHIKSDTLTIALRSDLNEEQAMRIAFEENDEREDIHPVDSMLYLYHAASQFGSDAVENIKSLGKRTARKYVKIGKVLAHLAKDDLINLKKKIENVSGLDPLESVSPSTDHKIMMERVRGALDAKRKAKEEKAQAIKHKGENIQSEIKLGPRVTTIRLKTDQETAEKIVPLIERFVADPGSTSESEPTRKPGLLARMFARKK